MSVILLREFTDEVVHDDAVDAAEDGPVADLDGRVLVEGFEGEWGRGGVLGEGDLAAG